MAVPAWVKVAGLTVLLAALGAPAARAQTAAAGEVADDQQVQRFSGPPERPRRHFRISDPADLPAPEAQDIYDDLRDDLGRRYRRSGDPTAGAYQDWTRFNTAPYRSATHGRRYVNNYANDLARDYGAAEEAGDLPVGAVVAKDSFQVPAEGEIQPGPLFVMEKMPEGFNYVSGDWRYSMITADGDLAGRTRGPGAERVEFCISCHLAREDSDHLFFVPPAFRPAP